MLKISYAGCLGLSPAISLQFTVEMYAAAKSCENNYQKPSFGVQGRSRLLMLTNLKSPFSVLVIICSKSVPICNRFLNYTGWAKKTVTMFLYDDNFVKY